MEPKIQNKRQQFPGGKYVETHDMSQDMGFDDVSADNVFEPMDFNDINDNNLDVDDVFTAEAMQVNPDMTGDDEDRRIEALKRAIDIAKLMDNVDVKAIISIAESVDRYLQETFDN